MKSWFAIASFSDVMSLLMSEKNVHARENLPPY
jgi:hypothetical protein